MTDDQLMAQFHRLERRLERLDTKVDRLEKRLSDGFAVIHAGMEGVENRLKDKADWRVVSLYTVLILGLMTLYTDLW
jgi:hypothetical protein